MYFANMFLNNKYMHDKGIGGLVRNRVIGTENAKLKEILIKILIEWSIRYISNNNLFNFYRI